MRPASDAHQSRLLYELCALLLTVLRASPDDGAVARPLLPRHVTPAGVRFWCCCSSQVVCGG
uniref:Uncharacterized protein n=1 Tax=Zea mays TaxID=4577 RepID=B6U5E5_MAIZE|nr:hypothetical protein [Zea mays]